LCLVFGVFAAWAKGPETNGVSAVSQLRSDLGNLSAPWLLVAFLAGTQASRPRWGALLGLAATSVALFGFYLFTSFVVDLGGHGPLRDFAKELSANRVYLEGGVLTGPLFGAFGAWARQRRLRTSVVVGALMAGELLVLAVIGAVSTGGVLSSPIPVLRIVPGWGLSASRPISLVVYGGEFIAGFAVLVLAFIRARSSPAIERRRVRNEG
jgi:hypothetical protein